MKLKTERGRTFNNTLIENENGKNESKFGATFLGDYLTNCVEIIQKGKAGTHHLIWLTHILLLLCP